MVSWSIVLPAMLHPMRNVVAAWVFSSVIVSLALAITYVIIWRREARKWT